MIVGFNLKGEDNRHRTVAIDTNDHEEAFSVVKEHYGARGIVRMMALIDGGKADVQKSE